MSSDSKGIRPRSVLKSERFYGNILAVVLIMLVTYLLYHDALNSYWRYDDGANLGFAAQFAPWQYFFIPDITRMHSISNVTPWNVLTYDINLGLFGFSPRGFYAHQLVALWLAGLGTFFLLRLCTAYPWALFGSLIFLAGAPTSHIANELMTGHYLEGLIFMIASLFLYIQAVRKKKFSLAAIGAFFYLLTVTAKEIYVPLPLLLLFIPDRKPMSRVRYLLPFFICAAAYIPWRYAVLGKFVGGYPVSYASAFDPVHIATTYARIPLLLFGGVIWGGIATLSVACLFIWSLTARKMSLTVFVAALLLTLLPLFPLVLWPGLTVPDRYLFLPWWATCCGLALIMSELPVSALRKGLAVFLSVFLLAAAVRACLLEKKFLNEHASLQTEVYRFILNSDNTQVFVRPRIGDEFGYFPTILAGILRTDETFNSPSLARATIVPKLSDLSVEDLKSRTVWRYEEDCKCVKNITSEVSVLREREKDLANMRRVVKIHDTAPETFEADPAGFLDAVFVKGRRVVIVGWVNLPHTEAGQTIHVFLPSSPASTSIEIVERPDVAAAMEDDSLEYSGFIINLDFDAGRNARQAASELCVAADSAVRPLTLVNSKEPRCDFLRR